MKTPKTFLKRKRKKLKYLKVFAIFTSGVQYMCSAFDRFSTKMIIKKEKESFCLSSVNMGLKRLEDAPSEASRCCFVVVFLFCRLFSVIDWATERAHDLELIHFRLRHFGFLFLSESEAWSCFLFYCRYFRRRLFYYFFSMLSTHTS